MDLKKRLGVQFLILLLAVAVWSGVMLTSAAALPGNRPEYTVTVEYYCEETGAQILYTEMIIGVEENANLSQAIQTELGAGWVNLYQDEYHQAGQVAGGLQSSVTGNVTVKVVYPLEIYLSSASRL